MYVLVRIRRKGDRGTLAYSEFEIFFPKLKNRVLLSDSRGISSFDAQRASIREREEARPR